MEKLVDTVIQRADKGPVSTHREACLVHIYPTGPWMGMRHTLSDRPLIVGAVPNPRTKSPSTSANATQSVTQTASGIRVEMEDRQS